MLVDNLLHVAMIVNFIVSITISNLTKEPPKEIIDLVENIRLPNETDD